MQRSIVSDDEQDSPTPLANGKEDVPTGAGSKYQQKKAKKQAKKQAKVNLQNTSTYNQYILVINTFVITLEWNT